MKNKHSPRRLKDYGDVLTPAKAMEFLGIGRNMMYRYLQSGKIKSIRMGKKYLIPKVYLIEFLQTGGYNENRQ